MRFFNTPAQESHYDGDPPTCFIKCENENANFYVFCDCPGIKDYWKRINNALQNIVKSDIPLEVKLMYLYLEKFPKEVVNTISLTESQKNIIRTDYNRINQPYMTGWM